ncbi:MAG: ribonuclease Z [Fimbriimonadaceae bacterium]|nr:ribonuclease Z [Chitinophagales bacterium]
MSFSITIIGSNSAIPAHGRHPSSQLVTIQDKHYLIDCGEGTQMRLHELNIRASRINHIFISHLHGDHYFGLIGLISTYHLLKRIRPLHIYAPKELLSIIQLQLQAGQTNLCYEIIFCPLDPHKSERILENDDITVDTILLKHRIDCLGFLFKEKKRERKVIKEKMDAYELSFDLVPELKKGFDITDPKTGNIIPNKELTTDPLRARSYAYCSDTAYNENMLSAIYGVDLMYHDCTFDDAAQLRAEETYHSTTKQAAQIAKLSQAKQLLIGHFSSKYENLNSLLLEAKEVFENTLLAIEGKIYSIER